MIEIGQDFKSFLAQFFLPANQLEVNLQVLSFIAEQITYVMIINQVSFISLFYVIPDGYTIFLVLIALSIAKYYLNISLIAAFGLIILQNMLES